MSNLADLVQMGGMSYEGEVVENHDRPCPEGHCTIKVESRQCQGRVFLSPFEIQFELLCTAYCLASNKQMQMNMFGWHTAVNGAKYVCNWCAESKFRGRLLRSL